MSKNHSSSIITVNNPSFSLDLKYLIDKLDFNPNGLILSDNLKSYWELSGFSYKPYITSHNQSGFICNEIIFLHQPYSSKYFYKIVSNPSRFESFDLYKNSLKRTIPSEIYQRMEIQTLDVACDIFNRDF